MSESNAVIDVQEATRMALDIDTYSDFVPGVYIGTIKPNQFCRAWNSKRKKYCRQTAGHNTDHKGEGRCAWHGKGGELKHGKYSSLSTESLRTHLERIKEEEHDRTDLTDEVDMLRAVVSLFTDRYEELVEALIAWNRQENKDALVAERRAKPQPIPDITMLSTLLKDAAKVADMMHRQEHRDSVPKRDFFRIQEAQSDIVAKWIRGAVHLLGEEQAQRIIDGISDEWQEIRL